MTDEIIYDQAEMLSKLSRHRDKDKLHIVMPRYQHIAKLLQWYKYEQNQLAIIQKEIDNIEPYKDYDTRKQ